MSIQFIRNLRIEKITAVKLFAIALLFAPMWGLMWHKVDAELGFGFPYWAPQVLKNFFEAGRLYQAAIYIVVYFLSLIGIAVIPFISTALLRCMATLVLIVGWSVDHFFLEIDGIFLRKDMVSLLWENRQSASDALHAYWEPLLHNFLLGAFIGAIFCIPPRNYSSLSRKWAVLPAAALLLVGYVNHYTGGRVQVFPVPYSLLANGASQVLGVSVLGIVESIGYRTSQNISPDRAINAPAQSARRFNRIIMIMDESVSGDFLSINDQPLETTPFLKHESRLINFGVAISGANCSIISRTMFRYGMRSGHLPEKWDEEAKRPLIWQYARRAGYRTVQIDGMVGPLNFQNGFSVGEKNLIDTKIGVLDNPAYDRDNKIADRVLALLADGAPIFLLVDKHGVHFPYELRYPRDEGIDHNEDRIHHYKRAITWSVDGFFRRLMPKLDLSNTLMVYTSDHGQDLQRALPHCSTTNVHPGEARVPLFAATGDRSFEQRLRHAARLGFNRMSHFEIFPTLLIAMGYDEKWVSEVYGPSLLDEAHNVRSFMVGNPYDASKVIAADPDLGSTRKVEQAQPGPTGQ
ncbi:MAG TPA: sulfatase-like hydrolase/transferase [Lacipirellulaceae bacterium]|nr:sulfatase-like hydrolase/transferase [Lacipirellulaceae bacterium]